MSAFLERFGIMIKESREAKGWNQVDLAKESGVKIDRIIKIEKGHVDIHINTAYRLINCLEISVDSFNL